MKLFGWEVRLQRACSGGWSLQSHVRPDLTQQATDAAAELRSTTHGWFEGKRKHKPYPSGGLRLKWLLSASWISCDLPPRTNTNTFTLSTLLHFRGSLPGDVTAKRPTSWRTTWRCIRLVSPWDHVVYVKGFCLACRLINNLFFFFSSFFLHLTLYICISTQHLKKSHQSINSLILHLHNQGLFWSNVYI